MRKFFLHIFSKRLILQATKYPEYYLYRFLFLFLISLFFHSCNREEAAVPPSAMQVRTKKIEPVTVPEAFEFVGFAQSSHLVEIRARVEGYLDKIAYKEGDMVKQGDLMFQ